MTQPNSTSPPLEKPLKDSNNDPMNLFNKVCIVKKMSALKIFRSMINCGQGIVEQKRFNSVII
jgi:hypothetical protein